MTGRALKNVLFVHSLVEKDGQEQKKEKSWRSSLLKWNCVSKLLIVSSKSFKISYKTRHWQLCFVYFYWCYCIFISIYRSYYWHSYYLINIRKNTVTAQKYLYLLLNFRYHLQEIINYLKDGRAATKNLGPSKTGECPYVLKTGHVEWDTPEFPDRDQGVNSGMLSTDCG